MASFKLPPGFRFHPTDVELMTYYLKRKVYGREIEHDVVAEVDLYRCEPWDLPEKALIASGNSEWYFFCAPDKKYANGSRSNRATEAGYWKATGKDRIVKTGTRKVGMKKTLVFYKGRAPHGERTNWVMHEYRLEEDGPPKIKIQDAFVLCRVFKKSGIGPKNPEYNSTGLDMEEADTTTQEGTFPDEKTTASELQAELTSADALTEEGPTVDSQMIIPAKDNAELSIPGESFDVHEPNDLEFSMLQALLWDSPNLGVYPAKTANGSTSELARLDSLSTVENPCSLTTDQDVDLWLPESFDAHASSSATIRYSADASLPNHTGIPELQESTQQLQNTELPLGALGADSLDSKYLLQKPRSLNFIAECVHEFSEMNGDMSNEDMSSMSEFKPLEADKALPWADAQNTAEEVPEEDLLEELLQLITKGQQSPSANAHTQEERLTGVVEDSFFDVQELDVEEWLEGPSLNDGSTSQLQLVDALESGTGEYGSWFSMPADSASNLSHVSHGLPVFSNSSLSMQTLHTSYEAPGEGQIQLQRDLTSADLTPRRHDVAREQHSSSNSSKAISRFSRLLDSLPALPASAAEFPLNMHKQGIKSNDLLETDLRLISPSRRPTACRITFRCTFEFLSGVWQPSSLEGSKPQILASKDEAKASTNARVSDIEVTGKRASRCCFERCESGCFLLVFFLGALSAVCWFLLLRLFWRLASHMCTLLM